MIYQQHIRKQNILKQYIHMIHTFFKNSNIKLIACVITRLTLGGPLDDIINKYIRLKLI